MKHRIAVLTMIAMALLGTGARVAVSQETILHDFGASAADGFQPYGGLILDAKGNLYGTTSGGGTQAYPGVTSGGTVFELTPAGDGKWTEKVLYNFAGGNPNNSSLDGFNPIGNLIFDAKGNLYGTTENGGAKADGTVFELSPAAGGNWTEKVLYSFGTASGDGTDPGYGALIFDTKGNLYGTTQYGGTDNNGTVFELSPAASGNWTEKVLHKFAGDTSDGGVPSAGLVFDAKGNLYGTTSAGGAKLDGVVFELTPAADGDWTETVLHNFGVVATDGTFPYDGLIFDAKGNLYGTTSAGGDTADANGVVFELTPATGGTWSEKVLWSFAKTGKDGAAPSAGLILDSNGNLYGTTQLGGTDGSSDSGGTVFELSPAAGGAWSEKLLHSFSGKFNASSTDGTLPEAGLVQDAVGNLYGTTPEGGLNDNGNDGVVFEIEVASTPTAALPEFSPAAGTYTSEQKVEITDSTPDATIYYTTNGATPTASSTKYDGAIEVSKTETIQAIAVATGVADSAVAIAKYTIELPATAKPAISPEAGTYTAAQTIKITDATSGAVIYYTTNGAAPTTASTKYTAAFKLSESATVKAIAIASGHAESAIASAAFTIETPTATPVFSPAAGSYTTAQSVKITCATAGSTIYYTVNGTTPTTSSTKYTKSIAVSTATTIQAIAVATGHTDSAVAVATYAIGSSSKTAAKPVFTPAAGTYTSSQSVKITDASLGTTIYYTTNGTTPTTASTKYTTAIAVAATKTIKAIAAGPGYKQSATASALYTIKKPAATPTFSPAAGTYASKQSVKIADSTAGATIYYTTNGTTPTTASTKYSAAITVSTSETLKAIAAAAGYADSAVASAQYEIGKVATPVFSLAGGTYDTTQSLQISDTTPGATIYYTTNGATPTPSSTKYTTAISVTTAESVQAIAVATGKADSDIASAIYDIGSDVTAIPTLSPAPGAFSGTQTVTMTDKTPSAVITYSIGTPGSTNVTTSTYTGPFTVNSTEYIAYDAIAPGYSRSPALEGVYTIGTVPAPAFSPVAGTYTTAQAVNFVDITPTATIYYTTDGAAPTTASAIYTGPIVVSANQTLRAIAAVSGLTTSPSASAAYIIGKGVAPPVILLPAGSYSSSQSVAISDITPGATIYYTTNGTTPTTSSTKYTGPIAVSTSETIEAMAAAPGDTNSAVVKAAYTIGGAIDVVIVTASGNGVVTVPLDGTGAFAVAAENETAHTFPTIIVSTSTGSNTSLPVSMTVCQTNPSTGQCLAAPAPTVTLTSFAPGASASVALSVFVTDTGAIASSPNNQIVVNFKDGSGTLLGSASVLVDTN